MERTEQIKGVGGALVISLDFELLWGVFDKVNYTEKLDYFDNTRKVIPEILKLFEKYEISCTWATVGMLFNHDWDEWESNIPERIPEYENTKLCAYRFGQAIKNKETEALCFAPELIKLISNTSNQEVGTHTYSHYYCLENGQNLHAFENDLKISRKLASKFNIGLKSLVFPRNQFNPDYLKVVKESGINNVRSNPDFWYWKNTQEDTLKQKIFRTGEAYIGVNNKSYSLSEISSFENGFYSQKASRLLRPHSSSRLLNRLRIKRILSEMKTAAKKGEVYHLWWHPHNFGTNSEKNLQELEVILKRFLFLKEKYGFSSFNMASLIGKSGK